MFRKFLCVAVLAMFSVPAQAGVLGSNLSFDGLVDTIEDTSVDNVIDNGDGILSAGDVLYGIASIDSTTAQNPTSGSLAIAFATEIASINATGGITFGLVSDPLKDIESLLGPTFAGSFSDPGRTIFAVLGNAAAKGSLEDPETGQTGALFTGNFTDDGFGGGLGGFASEGGWSVELTGGLVAADDFFEAQLFAPIDAFGFATAIQRAAFSVIDSTLGAGVVFTDVSVDPLLGGGTVQADVSLFDGSVNGLLAVGRTPTTGGLNGWLYRDSADFQINAVPEPSALLAFAGIGFAGVVSRRRRSGK